MKHETWKSILSLALRQALAVTKGLSRSTLKKSGWPHVNGSRLRGGIETARSCCRHPSPFPDAIYQTASLITVFLTLSPPQNSSMQLGTGLTSPLLPSQSHYAVWSVLLDVDENIVLPVTLEPFCLGIQLSMTC